MNMLIAAPLVPAPNTPIAKPRRSFAKKRATYGVPTAKEAPTKPSAKPSKRNCQSWLAWLENQTGAAQPTSSRNITIRPPNLSVQMPSGRRNNAPVSTGVEVNRPNSTPLRPSSFLIGIPTTPNITHTAKQTTNAQVVIPSTTMLLRFDMRPRWRADRPTIMDLPLSSRDGIGSFNDTKGKLL